MPYKTEYDEAREQVKKEEDRQKDPIVEQLGYQVDGPKISESFRWLTPQIKAVIPVGKNKVRIKGVAARSNVVSKNKRMYLEKELIKSVNSMIGTPITVNHSNKIIGNVEIADFEDGELEYVGIINKQPYAGYLKNGDPAIQGVSMDADYLYMKCMKCGETFLNEADFQEHMKKEHLMVDGVTAPHGIKHKGLSLVVSPEKPGIDSASVELLETHQTGLLKLTETIIQERGYGLQSKEQLGISKVTGMMKYTNEDLETIRKKYGWTMSVNAMVLGEGCRWKAQGFDSGEACVSAMQGKVDDPEAFCYGPAEEMKEQEEKPEIDHGCGEDEVWNPVTNACEPIAVVIKEKRLDEIFHKATKPQLRKVYETILNTIDGKYLEYRKLVGNDLREQLFALKNVLGALIPHLQDHSNPGPNLKETAEFTSRLETLEEKVQTLQENEKVRLRGLFKGHAKPLDNKSESYSDPEKDMRDAARKHNKTR